MQNFARAAALTIPKRQMSLYTHWKSLDPVPIGSNYRFIKFQMANRNMPQRLIHYKGPHTKSLEGGYYAVNWYGFPFTVFFVPTYLWAQCKYNGKVAADWGFGDEH